MKHFRYICTVFLLFAAFLLNAKEYCDTLQSSTRDKVTISYNVIIHDGKTSVNFSKVKKQLGMEHSEKYDAPDHVKVLFFEKNGGNQADKFVSDISTEALTINSDELDYTISDEGYVWLDENVELQLDLLVPETTLSIPVYLAYYKKKHTYEVIAYCGMLNIPLSQPQKQDVSINQAEKTSPRTNTIEECVEVEGDMLPTDLAVELIDKINQIMDESDGTTLPMCFDTYVSELRKIEMEIKDSKLKKQIGDVLYHADERKREADIAAANNENIARIENEQKELEEQVRSDLAYLNDRLANRDKLSEDDMAELKVSANELRRKSHSIKDRELVGQINEAADRCDEEMRKIEAVRKSRNILMIIGGILLTILMLVGNQAFQHFRNLRNQKRIAEMQDKMVKRAENEAQRRAQNAVRSRVNRIQNKAIGKGKETVRNGVKSSIDNISKGKGKKSITI